MSATSTEMSFLNSAAVTRRSQMQLADVLMGALAGEYNDLGSRPDASKPETDLAAYLAKRLRIKTLKDHTEWRNPLFEKWIFKFTGQPRPGV